MSKKFYVAIGLACLSASALVLSQQSGGSNAEVAPSNVEAPFLLMDRQTWSVRDPYNPNRDLSKANTLERRTERWKAILAIEFPQEYAKRFPKTDQEQLAGREAAAAIENPQPLDQFLQQPRSVEEQQALNEALDSILNPTLRNSFQ